MSDFLYKRLALIGVGLIGGSIALAARKAGLVEEIYGYSRREETRDEIRRLDLCDAVCNTLEEAVSDADLVILCTPVATYATLAAEIAPFLSEGATVSDVGSVKGKVVQDLQANLPDHINLIPGHPIAGTEHSGPSAGFADLFKDRWQILTPTDQATLKSVDRFTEFWEGLGATVETMTPEHHDVVLAMTSHVPHLVAYNLVGTAMGLEGSLQSEIIKFSAGGFRDSTRIAASDPTMWRDIFLTNTDAVLQVLDDLQSHMSSLRTAVEQGDGDGLFETFRQTRAVRRAIVEAGQAGTFDAREPVQGQLSDTGFLSMYGD